MSGEADISDVDIVLLDSRQLLAQLGDWSDCATIHGRTLQVMARAGDLFGLVWLRARPDEGPGLPLVPGQQWAQLPGTDLHVRCSPDDIAWQIRIGRAT